MMQFLLALDNFSRGSGGAGSAAQELARLLLDAGHGLVILETGARAARENWQGAELRRVRLASRLFPSDRDLQTVVLNPRWRREVEAAIGEARPALVITQGMLAPGAIEAARAARVPSAYFFHGYAPLCPEQFVGLDPERDCHRPDCPRCLGLARRLKWPLVRAALELYDRTVPRADLVVANSRYAAELLKRFWNVSAEVVYPSLKLAPAASPQNDPGGYLLFVKPQRAKGLDLLLKLAAACPERAFAVAGELRGGAAARLARSGNVRALGWRPDMDAVYRGARLVLGPSLLPEPFGRVFPEAAAVGCPTIAFRTGGIPEAIGAGGVFLDRSAGVADWARAIGELDDPVRYEALRIAALEHARKLAAQDGARRVLEMIERAAKAGPAPLPSPPLPERRLKVVHVISALPLGGAEMSLFHLVSRLDRERFEPLVVCTREEGELAAKYRAAGVRVGLLKLPSRYSPSGLFRLARLLAREQADVVHTHMRRANTSGRIAAWLAGVPVIIAHERDPGPDKGWQHLLVDRLLANVSAAIITVSPEVAETNARRSGLPRERFTTIPNGVDLSEFSPGDRAGARQKLGLPTADFLIGFAGRLHPVKNVNVLLRAAARALRDVPGLRLVLAGDGPERDALGKLAAELDLTAGVTFLGERQDMPAVYPAFDILCLPSQSEGCSRVLLEAAACALPLVATPVGYAPELVGRSEEAGLLVPVGDAEALARAIVCLARQPETRRAMAQAALRRAAEHGLDGHVRRMEQVYLDLWSRR